VHHATFLVVVMVSCRPETLTCESEPVDMTKILSEIPDDIQLHCVQ